VRGDVSLFFDETSKAARRHSVLQEGIVIESSRLRSSRGGQDFIYNSKLLIEREREKARALARAYVSCMYGNISSHFSRDIDLCLQFIYDSNSVPLQRSGREVTS